MKHCIQVYTAEALIADTGLICSEKLHYCSTCGKHVQYFICFSMCNNLPETDPSVGRKPTQLTPGSTQHHKGKINAAKSALFVMVTLDNTGARITKPARPKHPSTVCF